jgi:D-amino peptidase
VNDIIVGETGINAALAGYFGVPVVLVCGDDIVSREAKEFLPHVRTATVKTAVTRQSALCLPPERAQALIRQETEQALASLDSARPWLPGSPVTFKIEFKDSGFAENAARMPYSKLLDAKTVAFSADNYLTAFQGLQAMIALAC